MAFNLRRLTVGENRVWPLVLAQAGLEIQIVFPWKTTSTVGFMAATSMNCEGKVIGARGARDGDQTFLQGLAHGFQDAALELRQFV
jgi:hypothetical protein